MNNKPRLSGRILSRLPMGNRGAIVISLLAACPGMSWGWDNIYQPPYSGLAWTVIEVHRGLPHRDMGTGWGLPVPKDGRQRWAYHVNNPVGANVLLVMKPGETLIDNNIVLQNCPVRLHVIGLNIRMDQGYLYTGGDGVDHASGNASQVIAPLQANATTLSVVIEGCRIDMNVPYLNKSVVQDLWRHGWGNGVNVTDYYHFNGAYLNVGGSTEYHGEVFATQNVRAKGLTVENIYATYSYSTASGWYYGSKPNYTSVNMRRCSFVGYTSSVPNEVRNNDFSFATNTTETVAGMDSGPWNFTFSDVYQPWGQVGRCCTGAGTHAGHHGGSHRLTVGGGLRSTSPHLQSTLAPDANIGLNYVSPWTP